MKVAYIYSTQSGTSCHNLRKSTSVFFSVTHSTKYNIYGVTLITASETALCMCVNELYFYDQL